MKLPMSFASAIFILAASALAHGQSMPGMNMPGDPKPKPAQQSKPATKKATPRPEPAMPGMDMTAPARPQEQSMPGMDMGQPQQVQKGSITHDTMNLQEPENPTHKTGSNIPAPDLLKDVVSRQPMALQDFLGLADTHNPTLAQANAFVRRSTAQAQQAGLYPNPSVGYQGDQIRGGSYGGGEQGAYVQQTIVLGGKLGLRKNIYNQQKQSDQIGVEEQTYRVHSDVIQAFYAALTSQAMVVVRQRLVGVALDAVETVHQLANVGQADSPDILQAEVEAEQAKIDFVTAQREFIQKFRTLTAFAGKQTLPVTPLAGSLDSPPELDTDKQIAAIVESSPMVKRMQQEVAIGEARLREAKHQSIPDLQVRVGEQYNFEHITEKPVRATGPQSFASVGINLPLWNRNQGNVSAALAEVERAKQDVLRTQLSLKEISEPLVQAYLSSKFTAERYRTELIPRAQRAYQLYITKYQSMAMAYPQVLVSQRTLFQLQIGYLSALHDVWTNAVALQNYTLSGGLEAPRSTGSQSTSINPANSGGSPE
ncbi:MAG: TolC family protein [Acidobacteriota bacterium]|nr:TolC family protein [Acidobacteriota bacterium]